MAHNVGMLSNLPQGACGILLLAVIWFNVDHATENLVLASYSLVVSICGVDKREMFLSGADCVEALMKRASQHVKLSEVGLNQETLAIAPSYSIADTAILFGARF